MPEKTSLSRFLPSSRSVTLSLFLPMKALFCFLSFFIVFGVFEINCCAGYCRYIAHRADMTDAPEESYAAVDKAIENGFSSIECDVWKTDSGGFLIHHDPTLYRLCGVRKNICELDKTTRFFYPYLNKKYGTQFILTFEDMVSYAKKKGINVFFHLKVKDNQFSKNDLKQMQIIIDKYEMQNYSYLFSSNHKAVENMNGSITSFKGGANSHSKLSSLKKYARKIKEKNQCSFIIFKYIPGKTDKKELIEYCHEHWLRVGYYDIKDKEVTENLKSIGADFLILNAPVF